MRLIRLSPLFLFAAFACSANQGATETDVWEPFAGALADTQNRNPDLRDHWPNLSDLRCTAAELRDVQ